MKNLRENDRRKENLIESQIWSLDKVVIRNIKM